MSRSQICQIERGIVGSTMETPFTDHCKNGLELPMNEMIQSSYTIWLNLGLRFPLNELIQSSYTMRRLCHSSSSRCQDLSGGVSTFNSKKLEDIVPSSHNCDDVITWLLNFPEDASCYILADSGFDV